MLVALVFIIGRFKKTTWYMEESMNGEIQQESATSIEYENENSSNPRTLVSKVPQELHCTG